MITVEQMANLRRLDKEYAGFIRAQTRLSNQRTAIHFGYVYKAGLAEYPTKPSKEQLKAVLPEVEQDFLYTSLTLPIQALNTPRASVARDLTKEAEKLPFADVVQKRMKGLGMLTYARIVAQVDDFRKYDHPSKVWKRMGLAVFNGKALKRIKGGNKVKMEDGTEVEAATLAGYSPERRSLMWNAEQSLIKCNGKDGFYKKLYDARKVHELTKTAVTQKGVVPVWKKLAHERASRYMIKRVLRDLWCLWNGKSLDDFPVPAHRMDEAA